MNAYDFNNLINLLKCNKIKFNSFKWNNSFNSLAIQSAYHLSLSLLNEDIYITNSKYKQ